MSLSTYASPWTNDDTEGSLNKKRQSTMRKTVKKLPSTLQNHSESEQESFTTIDPAPVQNVMQNYGSLSAIEPSPQSTMSSDLSNLEKRNNRVSDLINKLTAENAGNQLSDFQPLSHPIVQKRTDVQEGRGADELFVPPQNNSLQIPPPDIKTNRPRESNFSAMSQDLGGSGVKAPYGNYNNVYDPVKLQALAASRNANASSAIDHRLMEKINYMVHLLEQQHNERTSNITEEFVLYTFLGVFIIFIVDAFSRSGKYVR